MMGAPCQDAEVSLRRGMARILWLAICLAGGLSAWAVDEVSLTMDRVTGPGLDVKDLRLDWQADRQQAAMQLSRAQLAGQTLADIKLTCPRLDLQAARLRCDQASVSQARYQTPAQFDYDLAAQVLSLTLMPSSAKPATPASKPPPEKVPPKAVSSAQAQPGKALMERWQLTMQPRPGGVGLEVKLQQARVARLAPWLPATVPLLTDGRLDGAMTWALGSAVSGTGQFKYHDLAFHNPTHTQAGEKMAGELQFKVGAHGNQWVWSSDWRWAQGDLVWGPFYLFGKNHRWRAAGQIGPGGWSVGKSTLALTDVGEAELQLAHDGKQLTRFFLASGDLKLAPLYQGMQTAVAGTAWDALELAGSAQVKLRYDAGRWSQVEVGLRDVHLDDKHGKFALYGVHGQLPWRDDSSGDLTLGWTHGKVLGLPVRAGKLVLRFAPGHFSAPSLVVPVLDGELLLGDVLVEQKNGSWEGRGTGSIRNVSMEQLSNGLGWPTMHGKVSAVIPTLHYRNKTLSSTGALLLQIFDGSVVLRDLKFVDPFGPVPRMLTSIDMNQIDLDLLTRAVKFGSIKGRVDVTVNDLVLAAWRPESFDLWIRSSAGSYPKKISQRAVANITSLGGGSGMGAIQGSLLRFFDEFGYSELGLRCVLRNDVCQMSGVSEGKNGYVIVRGGGIPALTVLGYNRTVGWNELVNRIKAAISNNAAPTVQ